MIIDLKTSDDRFSYVNTQCLVRDEKTEWVRMKQKESQEVPNQIWLKMTNTDFNGFARFFS
jgi:hypothetical protein